MLYKSYYLFNTMDSCYTLLCYIIRQRRPVLNNRTPGFSLQSFSLLYFHFKNQFLKDCKVMFLLAFHRCLKYEPNLIYKKETCQSRRVSPLYENPKNQVNPPNHKETKTTKCNYFHKISHFSQEQKVVEYIVQIQNGKRIKANFLTNQTGVVLWYAVSYA